MRAETIEFRGGACLAKNVNWKRIQTGLFGAAIADSSTHSSHNQISVVILDFESRPHFRFETCRSRDTRCEKMPAIYQRGVGINDLNRSCLEIVTLTDCILWTPVVALHLACRLSFGINTSSSAKTKFAQRCRKTRLREAFTYGAEVIVAGIGDGLGRIQWRQVARMRAGRLESVMRILFVAQSARVLVNHSRPQRREGSERFNCGAERKVLCKSELWVDHRADAARLRIHNDNGAAPLAQRESCRVL